MQIVTSMRQVRDIIISPDLFHMVSDCTDVDEYTPDPSAIYFKEGDGLVWYEPRGYACEMFSAVRKTPKKPVERVFQHWAHLASIGFNTVYAVVKKSNIRSSIMCRSCGMEKVNNEEINVYMKVLYGF